ncbi:MAG: dihydroorotate dehydrogenase electron transfer subunit [Spirochaetes bacterium]|nr:dihydroorotate dehydrogenase electron transfer subunit [Spirochaetota bacterium]
MSRLIEKPLRVSEGHFLLKIESEAAASRPGQFINIRVSEQHDPLLRRPFSIFSHERGVIHAVIKIAGRGTELLARREPGPIDILGPLGNGFTVIRGGRVLLVGGGVGNAPLHFLSRALSESGCDVTYLYGARSREYIYLEKLFRECANRFIVTTDDGSAGTKGAVTDAASSLIAGERFDMIYTCGPAPMMRAMSALAQGTPIEISVENYFGCGIGLCSGCTIETASGPRRACVDGPVFDGASILWDMMPD